jgi:DnaT-like ssDNA binding protein
MALTLIKEDGTGKVDANSYADIADGDAYHDGHLYASAWALSASDRKEEALVMATRVIDAEFQFNGWRTNDRQALQWPRENCPDPDRGMSVAVLVLRLRGVNFVDCNVVPPAVVSATCEMARELMIADRTAAPPGEGLLSTTTGAGSTYAKTSYSKTDTPQALSELTRAMLGRFGTPVSGRGGGAVRLTRG